MEKACARTFSSGSSPGLAFGVVGSGFHEDELAPCSGDDDCDERDFAYLTVDSHVVSRTVLRRNFDAISKLKRPGRYQYKSTPLGVQAVSTDCEINDGAGHCGGGPRFDGWILSRHERDCDTVAG